MSFIYSLTDYWTNPLTTYTSILMDVSNGAGGPPSGAAASRVFNLKNNGVSVFEMGIDGLIHNNLNITGGYQISSIQVLGVSANRTTVNNPLGQTIFLGGIATSDPTNYYSNDTHHFRNLAGGVIYGTLGTLGIALTNGRYLKTPGVTVAALPSATTSGNGARMMVIDANAVVFGNIVAGGGANNIPVYSDGTNWRAG